MAYLLAALPFLALAHANNDSAVFWPDREPPLGLSIRDFQNAAAQPNATNGVPVTGFGNGNSSDENNGVTTNPWGLRIGVTSDVELDGDEKVTSLTVLTLVDPNGAGSGSSIGDGKTCLGVFAGLTSNATREAQNDNGSCEMLSSSCRDDLVRAARDSDDCDDWDVPDSCSDWFSDSGAKWSSDISEGLRNTTSTGRVFAHGTSAEDQGSDDAEEAYARAVTHVWPVLLAWHPEGNGNSSAALRCIRARTITEGSDEPDEVPDRDEETTDSGNGSGSNGGDGDSDDGEDGNGDGDGDDNAAGSLRVGVLGFVAAAVAGAVVVA